MPQKAPFQTYLSKRTRNEHQETYDLPKGLDQPKSLVYAFSVNHTGSQLFSKVTSLAHTMQMKGGKS